MKYSCLEDSHSRKQSTLANSHVIYEEQLLDLEDREKDIWQNINNLRQAFAIVKRQTKRGLQDLREQCVEFQNEKCAYFACVLKALDAKIQFIIENCDKYIEKINRQVNEIKTKNQSIYEQAVKCQAIYQAINHRTLKMEAQVHQYFKKYSQMAEKLQQKQRQCEFFKNQLNVVSLQLGEQLQKCKLEKVRDIELLQKDIKIYKIDIEKQKSEIQQYRVQLNKYQQQELRESTIINKCNIQQSEASRSIVTPMNIDMLSSYFLKNNIKDQHIQSIVLEPLGPSVFQDYRSSQFSSSMNDTLMFYPK